MAGPRLFASLVLALPLLAVAVTPRTARSEAAAVAEAATPSADSAVTVVQSPVMQARTAYQAAWVHRQLGEYDLAVARVERALRSISETLAGDADMTTRRELTELQARLAGLRDVAIRDRDTEASAKAQGNEPDQATLNAPAVDPIQIQQNAQVARWVDFFTGAGRSTFERWLRRSGRYMDLFRAVLQKEGLPADLVHLVFVESGFNVNARSRSAAVGPWQFLRSTGRLFGLTVNQWTDERKDPEKSTVAAARYLKHLYQIFGDWPLALASYNAGEGTVLRAIKRQGTSNYWDLRLPRQTEEYVPQFMAVLAISRDPDKYGFDEVALEEPMAFDEVVFKGPVDLRALAKLADCSVQDLKELNPAVLNHAVSGRDGVASLRVPRGKGEVISERLKSGAKLPAVNLTLKHRVRRGETLQRIANRYGVGAQRLALANGIGRKHPLKRGTMLTIPASAEPPTPAMVADRDPRYSTAYVPARPRGVPKSLNAKSEPNGRLTHVVKRGETLASIASRYGVTSEQIRTWNRLTASRVHRGTRLKIRTLEASTPPATQTAAREAKESKESPKESKETRESKPATESSAATSSGSGAKTRLDDATLPEVAETSAKKSTSSRVGKKPGAGRSAPRLAQAKSREVRFVVVRAGDTLSKIADRHGVTVAALRRANRLASSHIRSGQRLRIPTA